MVIGRLRSHVGGSGFGFALKALPDINHLIPPTGSIPAKDDSYASGDCQFTHLQPHPVGPVNDGLPGHSGLFQVVWDHKFSIARLVE